MTWWQDILDKLGSYLFLGGGLTVVFGVGKALQKRRDPEITATQVRADAEVVQSDQQIRGAVESYAGEAIDALKANIAQHETALVALSAEVKDLRAELATERASRERAQAEREQAQADLEQARTTWWHLSDWVRDLHARWDELRVHATPPSGATRYLQN